MSIRVMSRVWEQSQHNGNALLVLLAIADFARDDGSAWPSIDTLRQKARISKRQVIRIIKKLEESGELQVKHRRHIGNQYLIMLKEITDNLTLIESKNQTVDDAESHLLSDIAESPISDTIESHDPLLTVKEPSQAKGARVISVIDSAPRESDSISSEDSHDNEGTDVVDDDVLEWFEKRKETEIKNGVRSPAEELPKAPRTEEDIKAQVRNSIIENAENNVDKDPVIESYLATVPEHVRELARVFCYHKLRPPLKNENAMWRREWQDQFDIGLGAPDVSKAFKYMQRNNLTVRSPMSTITVAENIRLGHIKTDEDMDVKIGEVSYDLPSKKQVEVGDGTEVSPMEQLLGEELKDE